MGRHRRARRLYRHAAARHCRAGDGDHEPRGQVENEPEPRGRRSRRGAGRPRGGKSRSGATYPMTALAIRASNSWLWYGALLVVGGALDFIVRSFPAQLPFWMPWEFSWPEYLATALA